MATNPIPQFIADCRAFLDGKVLPGLVDAELPEIKYKTATVEGAGMGGGREVPVVGQFEPMTLKLNFRVLTPELVTLSGPGPHKLDIRGAIQNSDTGSFTTTAVRASMTVSPVGVSPGSMKPGEAMDSGAEFSVGAYRLYIDGKCVREIDQENGVDKINGEDVAASASARKALGL